MVADDASVGTEATQEMPDEERIVPTQLMPDEERHRTDKAGNPISWKAPVKSTAGGDAQGTNTTTEESLNTTNSGNQPIH